MEVRYYLDVKDKRGEKYIFYDCNAFGFRIRKSTNFKIHPKFFKNYRVKENHPDAGIINKKLDTLADRTRKIRMQFISDMIKPSRDQFIEQVFALEEIANDPDLQNRFDEFIKLKGNKFTGRTRVVYQSAWNSLLSFSPKLKRLDSKVLNDYSEWLLEKNYSPNYINKNVNNIKRFCDYLEIPIKIKNPIKRTESDAIALDLEEVNRIIDTPMPSAILERAKDMFIFSCFTGLRFSDLAIFNPDYIKDIKGVRVIILHDKKEKNKCAIPVFRPTQKIINKYKGQIPKINVQDYRKLIKQVCALAGIKELVALSKPKGSTREIISMPKYEAISSHTARRSFITIMIEEFKHTFHEVGMMTGQKTDAVIEIYNKSKSERNAVKVFNNLKGRI